MMTELEKYYNKFNEEKRLKSRHGQVEFITSMKYIHKYLLPPFPSVSYDLAAESVDLLRHIKYRSETEQ